MTMYMYLDFWPLIDTKANLKKNYRTLFLIIILHLWGFGLIYLSSGWPSYGATLH